MITEINFYIYATHSFNVYHMHTHVMLLKEMTFENSVAIREIAIYGLKKSDKGSPNDHFYKII